MTIQKMTLRQITDTSFAKVELVVFKLEFNTQNHV